MLLELKNVSVAYRDGFGFRSKKKIAIDRVSFTVEEGENVGIVGSNGAGKSTLLKLLAGIYKPTSGEIVVHKPCRASFIGLASGFVPYLNGVQNIRLVGMLYGLSRSEIDRQLENIITYSELGEEIERPVYTYSAGMKARLAFSISVFSKPDLMLLDEVMGVGDASFRKKSSQTLKDMINGNTSAIIVSHEDTYLKSVCNKIIRLEAGRLVEEPLSDNGLSEIDADRLVEVN